MSGIGNYDSGITDGIQVIELDSWEQFPEYIQGMEQSRFFIWRGQRCDSWQLESTLDRILNKLDKEEKIAIKRNHLDKFKYATRGRRGLHPPEIRSVEDWWALGQHHGLLTPLLDWTSSPFAALFFSFMNKGNNQTLNRAVYAISPKIFNEKRLGPSSIREMYGFDYMNYVQQDPEYVSTMSSNRSDYDIFFIRPMTDENPRLVNQGGAFTYVYYGFDIETCVSNTFSGESEKAVLLKIMVPDSKREDCLISLNRMNINYLTLFPDLYGAGKYCNFELFQDLETL